MFFIALMSLSTTAVATIAAFFSVYGLAHTFTGAFWSVVAMGSALEAGKLMLASFVYRYKSVIGWRMKLPAYAFIAALMIVTSTGIYGYLSAAYQTDTVGAKEIVGNLDLKKQEQTTLQQRKTQIDQQISQLPTNDVRGRQRLMKQFDPEVKQVNQRLTDVTKEIQDLSQQQIQSEAHIGPIIYIAKMIGTDSDKAISILMLLIIFAFDPLAMLLTIATNVAIDKYRSNKAEKKALKDVEFDDEQVFRGKGWPKDNDIDDFTYNPLAMTEDFINSGDYRQRLEDGPSIQFDEPKKPGWFDEPFLSSSEPSEDVSYVGDSKYDELTTPPYVEEVLQAMHEQMKNEPPMTDEQKKEGLVMKDDYFFSQDNVYDPLSTQKDYFFAHPHRHSTVWKVEPEVTIAPNSEPQWFHTRSTQPNLPVQVLTPNTEIEHAVEETKQDVLAIEPNPIVDNSNNTQQIDQKEVSQEDQQLRDRLEKFEARQDLIRSTRRD